MSPAVLAVGGLAVGGLAERLLRGYRGVPPAAVRRGARGSVSVVVPARDEEATLPTLLRSLDGLTSSVGEVVVVDDASRDATAAVARAAGARVVAVDGPPAGWTGKAWACHVGARAAGGDVLVFLDADTELAPDALDRLLALLEREGGLVSVQPFHRTRMPYEQLSSYFNLVSLLASSTLGPQRHPMAFGPCLVTSRADYERAGGHEAVRGEILDDVGLAVAYHRAGLRVRCALGGPSIRMRMYPGGPAQLAEGWTKNFASGASAAAPGPTLVAVLWLAAHHVVALRGTRLLADVARGREVAPLTGLLGLLSWVGVSWQLRSMLRRIGRFRWWTWAAFPAPLLGFDVLFARSVATTSITRSVRWRGRDVPLDAARTGAADGRC